MSTSIYDGNLYEGYTLESLPKRLRELADKIEKETKEGLVEFDIDICGIEIFLDYREMTKTITV
jgi:hypothetical protein